MYWAIWVIFALAILAIGIGLLYLTIGVKKIEEKGSQDKYQTLPKNELEATGERDNKNHEYRHSG